MFEEECSCGAILPPGDTICELCGLREALARSAARIRELEEENAQLRARG